MSKRSSSLLASLVFALMLVGVIEPAAADAGGVVRFATLPKPGPGFPEGIAADAAGRIYVSTFDFSTDNVVYVFNRNGHRAETISLPGVGPIRCRAFRSTATKHRLR